MDELRPYERELVDLTSENIEGLRLAALDPKRTDWQANITADEEGRFIPAAENLIKVLKLKYGEYNVFTTDLTKDRKTGKLIHETGWCGVFVIKEDKG